MRKWGLVVTLFYAAVVSFLILPAGIALVGDWKGIAELHQHIVAVCRYPFTWAIVSVLIIGQALLLTVTVDTTDRRLKPKTNLTISAATTALLLAILTFAAASCIVAAVKGDSFDSWALAILIGGLLAPWLVWGIVFYRFSRNREDAVSSAVKWLLRGSVLELLIAVPSHVIVRRREDCCAPIVTAFGISTGLAIMLLSFGPSVLFLYKRRMEKLRARSAVAQ